MNKYTIHVPHQLLSETVQRRFFEMGYGWEDNGKEVDADIWHAYSEKTCFFYDEGFIQHDRIEYAEREKYTILSVLEFFAMEEDKKDKYPKKLMLRSVEVTATVSRVILINKDDSEGVTVTWDELEQILALKPKVTNHD